MITKICSICKQDKSLDEYYSQKKHSKTKGEFNYYPPYCKECAIEKARNSAVENMDKTKIYQKQWRSENKERKKELMRKWHDENKEEFSEYCKEWRKDNKERMSEHQKRYIQEKAFKISKKEWERCKEYFNNCCSYCGISEEEAKEKYNKGLNKEHAINKGKNDLSNCLVACTGCNSSKHKEDYTTWYIEENPVYDNERFNKIHKWLENDYKIHIKYK